MTRPMIATVLVAACMVTAPWAIYLNAAASINARVSVKHGQ
jgi:hypothetical protein